MRGLIDRIVISPDPNTGKPVVDLEGDLAGILSLGQTTKNAARISADDVSQFELVAGARNYLKLLLFIENVKVRAAGS